MSTGTPSAVEQIKIDSGYLAGTICDAVALELVADRSI